MESENKVRNANFSRQEVEVLVEEVSTRRELLLGKFNSVTTAAAKKRGWDCVAREVTAVGVMQRDGKAIKKKFTDMKTKAKKKGAARARELRKTGGGQPEKIHIDPVEERMLEVIGETAVEGIVGGFDTQEEAGTGKFSKIFA